MEFDRPSIEICGCIQAEGIGYYCVSYFDSFGERAMWFR
ncbi:hypothetical protein SAMN05192552_100237 [Natrinema hispanicum]|uniref:Uncharacterized protein n=1 Tax=Natrinema hispanicum TaxID=392421 RepID=A0A1H9YBL6_9EURY|nr:hypothetical protein SAMN05192552_100237 [Natrinema hispanicum]SES66248.1 hypothetical protein SAMN04488694_10137 [Natrinema hispanicum]